MDPPAPPQPHPQSSSAASPRSPVKLPSFPSKIRLMCSYGGHIMPRPHDKSLCYVGGDTRIVVIDRRNPSFSSLLSHLSKTLHQPLPFSLKYQLPNEDLDSLVSLSSDDDLENLIDEYDRLNGGPLNSSSKPSRIRLFLFSHKIEGSRSVGLPVKASEDWFLNALNNPGAAVGISRGFSDPARVDCLLGLNEEAEDEEEEDGEDGFVDVRAGDAGDIGPGTGRNVPNLGIGDGAGGDKGEKNLRSLSQQDVHSVPDSPMLETTSSFGSTSSSPSVANSGVRVEETSGVEQKLLRIEEQFGQMMQFSAAAPHNVGGAVATMGLGFMGLAELGGRVVSDDERSDRGGVDGVRKGPVPSPVLFHQRNVAAAPMQQNSGGSGGGAGRANGIELASPDSVSSDNSFTNSAPRQKPAMYYDQIVQMQSGIGQVPTKPIDPNLIVSDTATRMQPLQNITESGYILQPQHAQQAPLPQQFVPATSQYIPQHLGNSVPVAGYYTVYPSQHHQLHHTHQLDQQFPVFYVPISQMQAYNIAAKQLPGASESATAIASPHLQVTAQNPALLQQSAVYAPSTCAPVNTKAEVAGGGVYLTGAASNTGLVQVPSGQLQSPYVGFSHLHHQPQSITPASGAPPTFGYEFQSAAPAKVYFTQPSVPVASQYQTVHPGTGNSVMLPKALDQPPNDVSKQH
ncbi:hypothetical protein MLD38_025524 [Melastoma candidum]|uniref:Uncharacterized protein n=1 Tax=Melastoma candidum TaxID=119954 RepID=A0ACB9NYS1_9MYRT|nr:hypothetical protein MLD38_025524 [Melastoma candidum]